jgi:lysozyme
MKFSDQSRKTLTEAFEGCRLQTYKDSKGVLTIGYGHTSHVYQGQTCTQEQADVWLEQDIANAEAAVNRLVTVKLTQGEFDALVDFTFNVGVGAFSNSTLIHKLDSGDVVGAAEEFARWDYCGGVVLQGLVRRRLAEVAVFNS